MTHAVWVGLASVRDFWAGGREVSAKTFSSFGMDFGAEIRTPGKVLAVELGAVPASLFSVAWRKRRRYELPLGSCSPSRATATVAGDENVHRVRWSVTGSVVPGRELHSVGAAVTTGVGPRQVCYAPSPAIRLDIRGTPRGWVADRRADGSGDQSVRGNESALAHETGRASAGSR